MTKTFRTLAVLGGLVCWFFTIGACLAADPVAAVILASSGARCVSYGVWGV